MFYNIFFILLMDLLLLVLNGSKCLATKTLVCFS